MDSSKPKIFLYASEIASFIGQNKWDYTTPFERLWKKCDKTNYQSIINDNLQQIESIKNSISEIENKKTELLKQLEKREITQRQYTLRLNKLNKQSVDNLKEIDNIETKVDDIHLTQQQKLEKYLGADVIEHITNKNVETDDKRITINKMIENLDIDDGKLNNIRQHAESFINKTHGTLKEDDAIAIYEKKYDVKLDTSQQFNKKRLDFISENSQYEWYICGKVDGLYTNEQDVSKSYIVEVKNRTRGFFNNLRDYEKTQIQLYIWMLGVPIAKLVEKHESKIRVTEVYKDSSWINDILEHLSIFITAFENSFLNNDTLKQKYTLSEREEKQQILKRLYLNPIQKCITEKINKSLGFDSSIECDID